MAWIESHQELANHPKTLALSRAFRCGVPAAIGYLHLMWWWTISYATGGRLTPDQQVDCSRSCHYTQPTYRFWSAMVSAGFVDRIEGSEDVQIHDWAEYAGRLIERRQKNAERMRLVRSTSGARAKHVQRYLPDLPDLPPVGPVSTTLPARARDPGPGGPVAPPEPNGVVDLANGAQQCPICRQVFQGTYLEHTAEKHKVRDHPEDFRGKRGAVPYDGQLLAEVNGPLVPTRELAEEHERLLARERAAK